MSQNLRVQITKQMLDSYDKIIVMAEKETIPKWLAGHTNYEYWHMEDPKGKDLEFTRSTRDEIKKLVLDFINREQNA